MQALSSLGTWQPAFLPGMANLSSAAELGMPGMQDCSAFSEEAMEELGAETMVMELLEMVCLLGSELMGLGGIGSNGMAAQSAGAGSPLSAGGNSPVPGGNSAINWASQYLGTNQYQDLCGSFVANAYEKGAGIKLGPEWNANTAAEIAGNLSRAGKMHPYDPNNPPPPGAALFYGSDRNNGGMGHVVITTGGNNVISSGWPQPPTPVKRWNIADLSRAEGEQPVGWSMP